MKKITLLQAFAFADSFAALPDSGVSFKGLASLDIAMNCTKIDPLIIAYKKQSEPSAKYKKYQEELRDLQLEEQAPIEGKIKPGMGIPFADGRRAAERIKALRDSYAAEIKSAETKADAQEKALDKQIEIDLIEISRSDIVIADKSDRAAKVLAGLSICIR